MKIVTIDFDIIMDPSINVYNDEVGVGDSVADYLQIFPFLDGLLPADLFIYEYLTTYLLKCCKLGVKPVFINEHMEIIREINQIKKRYPDLANNIDLINIDHHHDITYDEDEYNEKVTSYNVGNWVKYLQDKKMIRSYEWINNPNSLVNPECEKFINKITELKNSNLDKLAKSTDALVICESFEWVPPSYHPLFSIWQEIARLFS